MTSDTPFLAISDPLSDTIWSQTTLTTTILCLGYNWTDPVSR